MVNKTCNCIDSLYEIVEKFRKEAIVSKQYSTSVLDVLGGEVALLSDRFGYDKVAGIILNQFFSIVIDLKI